ncbi:MAG: agmatine deiminase family protein [Cyanobacteria bacterium P01_H01_bin.121]
MWPRRTFLKQTGLALTAMASSQYLSGCRQQSSQAETAVTASQTTNVENEYRQAGATLLTQSTPLEDGFYFPAEWDPHEFTIMAFPPAQNWQGYLPMPQVWDEWALVANTVNEFEPVLMVVDPADLVAAQQRLSASIEVVEFPLNDAWSRDTGPLFLVDGNGQRRATGFTFNGWGEKFPPYKADQLLKARLCEYLDTDLYPADLVVEGGAVVLDGQGTAITTAENILNANRNPGVSRAEVEAYFRDYLGAEQTIWLEKGLVPDPITDGHVDGLCVFAAPGVVLLETTDDRNDPNFAICQDAKQRLTEATDAKGRSLEIIELPLTSDVVHVNFYIANGGVIVPTADDPAQDDEPLAILRETFPDREVVGVSGVVLAEGGGGVHCITQQVPKVS